MKRFYTQKVFGFAFLLAMLVPTGLFAQYTPQQWQNARRWADSVYHTLPLEQCIGQLIITRANNPHQPYDQTLNDYIKRYNLGGVSFLAGDPVKQALQINRWNKMAKTPLFVAMDAEWGVGMRLSGTISYPYQMTLGAFRGDDSLLYKMGWQIGKQCQRLGIQIDLAPVVDVNSNPENPVIGMRSFGSSPQMVAEKAFQHVKGMENAGILACAKHFPGHGDTYQDSHKTLPLVKDSKKKIEQTALLPYRYLFSHQPEVSAVMVAHLNIPALEKREKSPPLCRIRW